MPQPQYSPALSQADFFLFPKLNTPMKRKRFATIKEIWQKQKVRFRSISKIGKNAGISVFYMGEVTVKGAR